MNRNTKVLVLTTNFLLKDLPLGLHIYNKCNHLTRKGIGVTIIAPHKKNEPFYEKKGKIEIIRFPYFYPFSLQKIAYNKGLVENLKSSLLAKVQLPLFFVSFVICGLIYGKKSNIIHAHWFPAGLVGLIIKKMTNKKLVLMMHHPHKKNLLYKLILKNTDFLFANSSYVLNKTLDIYPVSKYKILPVPINHEQFLPKENSVIIRKKLGVEDCIFVFSAGRFIKWKGFEYLIEAFNILINKYHKKGIKLRIAGRGPMEGKYRDLINHYELNESVKLIGYIINTKMPEYYNAADIFVIPSIIDENGDTEGLGLVSLEANACETPVIGTRVGGIVDVIDDGVNGFLVDQKAPYQFADKIIELSEHHNLRNAMGENGRKRIKKQFNWNNITENILNIYNQL